MESSLFIHIEFETIRRIDFPQLLSCLLVSSPLVLRLLCVKMGKITYSMGVVARTGICRCHKNAPISTRDWNCKSL